MQTIDVTLIFPIIYATNKPDRAISQQNEVEQSESFHTNLADLLLWTDLN